MTLAGKGFSETLPLKKIDNRLKKGRKGAVLGLHEVDANLAAAQLQANFHSFFDKINYIKVVILLLYLLYLFIYFNLTFTSNWSIFY